MPYYDMKELAKEFFKTDNYYKLSTVRLLRRVLTNDQKNQLDFKSFCWAQTDHVYVGNLRNRRVLICNSIANFQLLKNFLKVEKPIEYFETEYLASVYDWYSSQMKFVELYEPEKEYRVYNGKKHESENEEFFSFDSDIDHNPDDNIDSINSSIPLVEAPTNDISEIIRSSVDAQLKSLCELRLELSKIEQLHGKLLINSRIDISNRLLSEIAKLRKQYEKDMELIHGDKGSQKR